MSNSKRIILFLMFSKVVCLAFGQGFSFFEAPRYITHITQEGGGFSSTLVFNNAASTDKEVTLDAFGSDGQLLMGNIRLLVDAHSVLQHPATRILPENTSYIIIGGSKRVLVSVRYDNLKGSRGMSTHLHESDQAANRYHVYPGAPSGTAYWEGAAIVNLTPAPPDGTPPIQVEPPLVTIELKNKSNTVIGTHKLPLPSGAKALAIFHTIFPQVADQIPNSYYYEIRSEIPLGVTALMGNASTNDIASAHPAAPLQANEVIAGDLNNLPTPDYSIMNATLEEDVITIRVAYDPSCSFEPTLFWSGSFQESWPVQTRMKLALVGQGAFCLDTVASQEIEFDLGQINSSYASENGHQLDPIIVHLLDRNNNVFKSFTMNPE